MSFNIGFKALVYPASDLSDPITPCSCSLVFRCDDAAKQATVLVVITVPTAHGSQTFFLQYDADKLSAGAVSLSSGNNYIPRSQLDELLRDKTSKKRSDIKTLALSIKQPCPIWCPHSQPSFACKPGFELSFQQFVDLTIATTIHIVFDYKYLQKQHQGMFRAFGKAAKDLAGYPVEGLLTKLGLRKASWEVFGPVSATGAPPAYDNSRKRPRQASFTVPGQSPKRFAPQSPTESHTSEKTVPLSPATADAIQRALRRASPAFDYQAEAINAAVCKQLPAYLNTALLALLPDMLPDILPTLFTGALPKSSLRTPNTSFDSSSTSPQKLPKLTPLGHALLPHLRTHLADQFEQYQTHQLQEFQKLLDRLWNSAEGDRAHETAEMMEEIEEHKADMMMLKADTIKDLSSRIDEVFAKGQQEGLDLGEELVGRLGRVFGEVCDKIDGLKRMKLQQMVAFEVRKYKRRKKDVPRGVGKSLVRGHQKLLGRRREAEEVEWIDC